MKILIFIEVDVAVRHFIHNHTFDNLASNHDIKFVFSELGHKRMSGIDPASLNLPADYEHLKVNVERYSLWKRLYLIRQIAWRRGKHVAAMRRLIRDAIGWKATIKLTFLGLPLIRSIDKKIALRKLFKNRNLALENLIDKEMPDVIIHPCVLDGVFLNDLVELSNRRNIESVVIMNSWDNPSSKMSMFGNPDWMLVWGEQTNRHAIDFAGMKPERTLSFGVAQFEVYRDKPRIDRKAFLELNGMPEGRPILLYAGSSKGTAEFKHLQLLENAIEKGDLPECNILYRPHPWGSGGAGGEKLLLHQWKYVYIESTMRGYLQKVSSGYKGKNLSDYKNTHDVLSHIDALISPLSTIILEGALHGKPVMCFMPTSDGSAHFKNAAELIHFHEIFDIPEIIVANGYEELIFSTRALLLRVDDEVWSKRLVKMCDYFVKPFEDSYGKRLVTFVESIQKTTL